MTPLLELVGVCRNFGGLVVASDISFTLAPGDRTALIGPNGAGKTTLVNLVTGRIQPSSGDVRLDGKSVAALSEAARVRAGIVRTFQVTKLFRDETVRDNLRIAVIQRERRSFHVWRSAATRDAEEAAIEYCLTSLRLQSVADRKVRNLAYSEQRLLEIALALALKPRVLLLDEPAAGVPPGEASVIMNVVAGLSADLAVLLIEHDMDLVFKFAQKIIVMASGAVVAIGDPASIASNERVRDIYFGRGHHAARYV